MIMFFENKKNVSLIQVSLQ